MKYQRTAYKGTYARSRRTTTGLWLVSLRHGDAFFPVGSLGRVVVVVVSVKRSVTAANQSAIGGYPLFFLLSVLVPFVH